jgi:hypothetical protein
MGAVPDGVDDDEDGKSLSWVSLNMRMRMGSGEGIKERNVKNGDRLAAFTVQHWKQ